jgi:hypothetical protein
MLPSDARPECARKMVHLSARRWLLLISCVVLVGLALTLYALPEVVRRVAIARIHALTGRPVVIDRVDLSLLAGRFTVRGFRLAERGGQDPFADFGELEVRLHLPSLLIGRLWIRDMVLSDSTVRVVRLPTNEFNFSDLIGRSETTKTDAADVTVDHFVLRRGTVVLEDRALPQRRTWASEHIAIEAHNVSTRRGDGTAVGSSVTAGTPVSFAIKDLRLHPIHVHATMAVQGLDLTLAQVYLPPDSIIVDRGHATAAVTVTLDARDGIRADATGKFENVALLQADGRETVALVPNVTARVNGFAFKEGDAQIGHLALDGALKVRDPMARQAGRYQHADVRVNIANLTWPATTPGLVDILANVQGGGKLAVTGTVNAPPAASQLRLRATNFDMAPWAQLLPIEGRVAGVVEADLRVNEALAAGIPARIQGSVAVNRLAITDARREIAGAQRIEASGLELHWPTRFVVTRVLVSGPRGIVERDRSGHFPLTDMLRRASPPGPATVATTAPGVEVGEIVVRNGALSWRDQSVAPPARLDMSNIDGRVTGIGWPLRGPAGVRIALRPPGGGQLQVTGRVDLDPVAADVRVQAKNAELAPYQSYLPTTARLSGAADLDLAIVVPSLADGRGTARGRAGLARVDVRDGERTVMRVERALATGVDVEWPTRADISRLALTQPWFLLERDEKGALPLRALLPARSAAGTSNGEAPLAVTVAQLDVERGGMRVVDRAVSPAFAVDLQSATARAQGLSTAAAKPARLDVNGQLGPGANLMLRGTVGALGGPLKLDVNGELREFAVERANPYVLAHAGWKTIDGRLTSTIQCRIDGDALSAKTKSRISRLQLVRATAQDNAQARIGLPLGMLTSLMKDKRGDINVAFPVGGRLSDPRFDFSEAIWGAVRSVAINAVALPVSWIGRMHVSADSKIQRIDVDPLPFEPGTAELTPEGQARVARVAAFLDRLPEVKMALTPVISANDVKDPKHDAIVSATAVTPEPTRSSGSLAERRVDVVRSTLKQAGIDLARLEVQKPVQQNDGEGHIALNVLEPEPPRSSKVRDTIERVRDRLKGSDAKE